MSSQNKPLKSAGKAGDFHALAHAHLKKGEFAAARPYLEQSLAAEPTSRAHHDLGVVFFQEQKIDDAVAHFEAAVKLDAAWHQSYANLYRIMQQTGKSEAALKSCALAIKHGPDVEQYKEDFVRIAQSVKSIKFDPLLKEAVIAVLRDYDYNHQEIFSLWAMLLECDPAFAALLKLTAVKSYEDFKSQLSNTSFFSDLFLLWGLRRLLIANTGFENFVKYMRRFFLYDGDAPLEFIAALAEYCFYTEYVISVTPEEQIKIADLEARIEKGAIVRQLCVFGCYEPLFTLKNATALEKNFATDNDIGGLITLQISEPLQERAMREMIPAFSKLKDKTSISVREQYEEFPYPRWKSLSKMYANEFLAVRDKGEAHSVLNAGCGTGRSALSYAIRLPRVEMIAVDLSLSSICYAKREAEKRGIKNITFMHGDILELEKIGKTFDLVQSTGVIHHMRDPMEGWRSLVKVLKPNGLMRMALYSEIARRDLVKTQKAILEKGYASDTEGMRAFRDDVAKVMPTHIANELLQVPDFYSLSQCRDLLFHVQELRFDIPMLKKSLDELGLEFIGFSLSTAVMEHFGASAPDARDLDAWAVFEEKHPKTFAAMYQFWCRKIN
jgi:SAM-dependent methyltransferase